MRDVLQFDDGDSLHIGEQGVLAIRLKGSEQLRPIALASSVRWVQHRFAMKLIRSETGGGHEC